MTSVGFLTDEHVPGPFLTNLRSIGYDVLRVKDQFRERTEDGVLVEFEGKTNRVAIARDNRFSIVNGERITTHAGVMYADQASLQRRPEDMAGTIDRIVTTMPLEDLRGSEVHVNDWM
jgi:hypothetical protein